MPKLRRLSGAELIRIFGHFGFEVYAQRGSHIKLRRIKANGEAQTLTVPNHGELDTGTTRAILRQATRYVSEDELHPYFYTD
jgi:predicted RNA binding protein YcfA (HicA-like mRNA interferase family)